VDGCFWHGCPVHSSPRKWLKKSSMKAGDTTRSLDESRHSAGSRLLAGLGMTKGGVRTGKVFWRQKMIGNMARDRFVNRALRRRGWKVVRLWEHELAKAPGRCVRRVRKALGVRS
jgi:G:T-mismatch repair DNA endonuclease (very short patch repair protein)